VILSYTLVLIAAIIGFAANLHWATNYTTTVQFSASQFCSYSSCVKYSDSAAKAYSFDSSCKGAGGAVIALSVITLVLTIWALVMRSYHWSGKRASFPYFGKSDDIFTKGELYLSGMILSLLVLITIIWGATCYNATIKWAQSTTYYYYTASYGASGYTYIIIMTIQMCFVVPMVHKLRLFHLGGGTGIGVVPVVYPGQQVQYIQGGQPIQYAQPVQYVQGGQPVQYVQGGQPQYVQQQQPQFAQQPQYMQQQQQYAGQPQYAQPGQQGQGPPPGWAQAPAGAQPPQYQAQQTH